MQNAGTNESTYNRRRRTLSIRSLLGTYLQDALLSTRGYEELHHAQASYRKMHPVSNQNKSQTSWTEEFYYRLSAAYIIKYIYLKRHIKLDCFL